MGADTRATAGDAGERWELPRVGPENGPLLTASQLEDLQRQAWDEAFAQGREAGHREGREQAEAEARRLAQIADALCRPFERLDQQVEEEVVALSIAVASQIARREIQANPEQVVAVVREALASLPVNTGQIAICLCPADAALVKEALDEDIARGGWTITEDAAMAAGDCRVRCDYTHVDATLRTRLERVVARLLGDGAEDDADNADGADGR